MMTTTPTTTSPTSPTLDVKKRFEEIRAKYAEDNRADRTSVCLLGRFGTGKTHFLRTAPKPVLIDCFDPSGLGVLDDLIQAGEVLPRYWTGQDHNRYKNWQDQFNRDLREDFFSSFGTYCIDSGTMFVKAILDYCANVKHHRTDGIPAIQDYMVCGLNLANVIQACNDLSCHFIFTGHLEFEKDETTGEIMATMRVFKSQKVDVPVMFPEKWVSLCKPGPNGNTYRILTARDGRLDASTQMGRAGKLDKEEEPDFRAMLKKCGIVNEDKDLHSIPTEKGGDA